MPSGRAARDQSIAALMLCAKSATSVSIAGELLNELNVISMPTAMETMQTTANVIAAIPDRTNHRVGRVFGIVEVVLPGL